MTWAGYTWRGRTCGHHHRRWEAAARCIRARRRAAPDAGWQVRLEWEAGGERTTPVPTADSQPLPDPCWGCAPQGGSEAWVLWIDPRSNAGQWRTEAAASPWLPLDGAALTAWLQGHVWHPRREPQCGHWVHRYWVAPEPGVWAPVIHMPVARAAAHTPDAARLREARWWRQQGGVPPAARPLMVVTNGAIVSVYWYTKERTDETTGGVGAAPKPPGVAAPGVVLGGRRGRDEPR